MAKLSQDAQKNEFNGMSLDKIEEIRSSLRERKGGLAVNQQVLFNAVALPPGKRRRS